MGKSCFEAESHAILTGLDLSVWPRMALNLPSPGIAGACHQARLECYS